MARLSPAFVERIRSRELSNVELGLLREDGTEEDDAGYSRQRIDMVTIAGGELANGDPILFPAYRFDAQQPVTGWIIAERGGGPLIEGELERARRPRVGDRPIIDQGRIRIGLAVR